MSTSINVPFWPATLDCVRWSQDNLIAIAGSEAVAILSPKLKTRSGDTISWDVEVLKINTFTAQEMPLMQPMSFANWSLGQEISLRYVQTMAWSTPGLGSSNTSVLAILHSDFTLVLWEYRGRAAIKDNWSRCLVITTAIRGYYIEQGSQSEAVLVRARVRSMAWCPRDMGKSSSLPQQQGVQFLAVTTEAGDILIIEVRSPYDVLRGERHEWTATVCYSIRCSAAMPRPDQFAQQRAPILDDYDVLEELIWRFDELSQRHTFITLIASRVYIIHWQLPQMQLNEVVDPVVLHPVTPPQQRIEPPLRLSSDGLHIVYIAEDTLVVQALADGESLTTHTFLRRWSEIAGIALLSGRQGATKIYPALHSAYHRQNIECITVPELGDRSDACASIISALAKDMKDYARKLELAGGVKTYIWGIDGSPSSMDVACCYSMLPADSPAHQIQSEQFSTLHIAQISAIDGDDVLTGRECAESILFTLQQRLASSLLSPAQASMFVGSYITSIPGHYASQTPLGLPRETETLTADVLLHPDRLKDMQDRLLALAYCQPYQQFMPTPWYIALIQAYCSIAATTSHQGRLSQRISSMHRTVQQKLTSQETGPAEVQEICSICNEPMVFEALKWARCSSGHRFARCALTFLAIPQAGQSKACGLCGTQYLNEHKLPELDSVVGEPSQSSTVEPSLSPARILFAAFHVCIMCNGRFIA